MFNLTLRHNLKAVTLIEIILYLALFGVIFTSILSFASNVDDVNQFTKSNYNFDKQIVFFDQHLKNSFNQTMGIDASGSVFNSDNGMIILNTSTSTITYRLENSRIIVSAAAANDFISQVDVDINKFYIEPITMGSEETIKGVRILLEMSKDNAKRSISASYIVQNDEP